MKTATRPGLRVVGALLLGGLMLSTGACYQYQFTIGEGAPTAPVEEEEWRSHWLWGLISPDNNLELRDECSSENATIEAEQTFLNGLVSVLTGGIYSPTTVRVRCGDGTAWLDLDEADVARIISAPEFVAWVDAVLPERLEDVIEAQGDRRAE